MAGRVDVPITRKVLRWALDESGLSISELADASHIDEAQIASWLAGTSKPSITQLRAVSSTLDRQLAVFLLPAPPAHDTPAVAFRHPMRRRRALNASERRFIRRAGRLQSAHRWLAGELNLKRPELPTFEFATEAATAADAVRALLGLTTDDQRTWNTAAVAFDHWRAAVESLGVIVLKYPMGEDSCRGFSLFDTDAPVVAVNTGWRTEARIFTLFHEIGHLVTRSNSACAPPPERRAGTEPIERWCEAFAAAVVIPADSLATVDNVSSMSELSRLAANYKISLRAMAIRLIDLKKATWALYRAIPPAADAKRKATGGAGRSLRDARVDEFGWRGIEVFLEATRREVISESQALDYLEMSVGDFEHLAADAHLR